MGMGGHNVPLIKDGKGIRKLTPRECARIQGFPESYKLPKNVPDTKLYKQFGNSVTVTVIERVAEQIRKGLESGDNYVSRTAVKRTGKLLRTTA
jgi:DNA (cytosine-5)-methyltransferase 1